MDVWEIILYVCLWHVVGFVMWIALGGCFNVQVIKYSFGVSKILKKLSLIISSICFGSL